MQRRTILGILFLSLLLRDEAYRLPDAYAGRAGVSWLYRWAVSRGIQIDWKREPEPPAEIQTLYNRITSPPK